MTSDEGFGRAVDVRLAAVEDLDGAPAAAVDEDWRFRAGFRASEDILDEWMRGGLVMFKEKMHGARAFSSRGNM